MKKDTAIGSEVVFEIVGNDPSVLGKYREALPEAEIEFHSGLGGLEIIGTILIPGLALALQLLQLIRENSRSDPSTRIVSIHVHHGDRCITISSKQDENIETAIIKAFDDNNDIPNQKF